MAISEAWIAAINEIHRLVRLDGIIIAYYSVLAEQ